jgi:hypothetical protein
MGSRSEVVFLENIDIERANARTDMGGEALPSFGQQMVKPTPKQLFSFRMNPSDPSDHFRTAVPF